jgi:hypothetical protein
LAMECEYIPTCSYRRRSNYTSATFYTQNNTPGSCGTTNPDSAIICALHPAMYNMGAKCGNSIKVTNIAAGVTVVVKIADVRFFFFGWVMRS